MEKYGFVYIWYDRKHKRYYIGCRWGNERDGYVCSSAWMKQAYKHRPNDFRRRILARVHTTRKDLLQVEHKWLSMIEEADLGKKYYNLTTHRNGHWSSEELRRKTIGQKIQASWTEEKRQRARNKKLKWISENTTAHEMITNKAKKANKGRKHTEEWKKQQSDRLKSQWASGKRKTTLNMQRPRRPREKVVCPHCLLSGDISIMSRWHFNNCKEAKVS